jgi:molecular chaperone DnaJ
LRQNKTVKVQIPAGIDAGQTIPMRGQGNAGANGGEKGDLYVIVNLARHPGFTREGTSVMVKTPVTIVQAALGAEIEVLTLDGRAKLTNPEGTQSGTTFRMRGKGIPNLHGSGRGDQFVTINVTVPTGLNAEQKDLLRMFDQAGGGAGQRQQRGKRK